MGSMGVLKVLAKNGLIGTGLLTIILFGMGAIFTLRAVINLRRGYYLTKDCKVVSGAFSKFINIGLLIAGLYCLYYGMQAVIFGG